MKKNKLITLIISIALFPSLIFAQEINGASKIDSAQYHFDCRPLMIYHDDTAANIGSTIIEVLSYLVLTPVGGGLLTYGMGKSKYDSFYGLFMNRRVNNVKLFHLVNYIQSRAGFALKKPQDYAGGKPLQIIGSRYKKKQKDFEEKLDLYQKKYDQFADQIGKELTLEFYEEFRRFKALSDEEIDHYLYVALFKLNFSYGEESFCNFDKKPGRYAWSSLSEANFHVVSYKKAKRMLLDEALRIAKEDIDAGTSITGTNPPPPSNPFDDGSPITRFSSNSSWQAWFKQYGPKEPYAGYYR